MRDRGPYPSTYGGAVVDLPRLESAEDRRAVWRQTLVLLARGADGPGPLEGLHPDALLAAIRTALADGLVDDTDWLAEPAAGAALYELAAVVPPSNEQRELGRRVLARLLQGGAETFAAIATRMALGTGKGLSAPHVRARIALLLELPLSLGVASGPLCLALVARRQLARDFVVGPSTESLPARRSAALIFEHAAREAARRALQGDEHPMRAFVAEGAAQAFERLLADREPLVWRHAAAARGMLAPWIAPMLAAVQSAVDPKLSPTEWRRAGTSIAALLSVDPDRAGRLVKQWMSDDGPLARDPGGASALVWGLARGAESEPEAAAEILARLTERMPVGIAEAVVDLGVAWGSSGPFEHSIGKILQALRNHEARGEEEDAVHREIVRDLERLPRARASLSDAEARADDRLDAQVGRALAAYATEGARAAYAHAKTAFDDLHGLLDALEAVREDGGAVERRTSLAVVSQLDHALLERSTLADLLRLAPSADVAASHQAAMLAARERIAEWIVGRFRESEHEGEPGAPVRDATLRLRRLRALLHLVDSDLGDDDGGRLASGGRAGHLRKRWSGIASVLLRRIERGLPPVLRRANAAALSRTLDALVRAEALDPADALLAVARRVTDPAEMRILSEASMDPALRHALSRYADLAIEIDAVEGRPADGDGPLAGEAAALASWAEGGLLDPSSRAESLRTVVVRMEHALRAIARARSLSELCSAGGTDADVVAAFETAAVSLAQLSAGARARLDAESAGAPPVFVAVLAVGVARVLSGAQPSLPASIKESVLSAAREIPGAFRTVVARTLDVLAALPAHAEQHRASSPRMAEALPSWLPPRRTLGGFYVLRPLASGGGGSVLVAVRIEDRQEDGAERFALKVPSYDASAARTVSEAAPRGAEAPEPRALRHVRHRVEAQADSRDGAGRGAEPRPRDHLGRPRHASRAQAARRRARRARGDARRRRRPPRPQAVERGAAAGQGRGARRLRARRASHPAGLRDRALRRAGGVGRRRPRRDAAHGGRLRVRVRGVRGAHRRRALPRRQRARPDHDAPHPRRLPGQAPRARVEARAAAARRASLFDAAPGSAQAPERGPGAGRAAADRICARRRAMAARVIRTPDHGHGHGHGHGLQFALAQIADGPITHVPVCALHSTDSPSGTPQES
jgi:hypothetical protein